MAVLEKYLKQCLGEFREVTREKYGIPNDFTRIEGLFAPLCDKRPLTYEELRVFESPDQVWFQQHWFLPPENRLAKALKDRSFDFRRLPGEEGDLITSLLNVFKSIEVTSIILRFVKPELYGMTTPPVEKILDVRRGNNAVSTYLNYLRDLRDVRRYYHFQRTADADMALWVLHERYSAKSESRIWQAYEADPFLLRLRAKNLMDYFVTKIPYPELANALIETNLRLSAQIAGIAFEQMVRQRADAYLRGLWNDRDLKDLIDELHHKGLISRGIHGEWDEARRARNEAIHGSGPMPLRMAERLLDVLHVRKQ